MGIKEFATQVKLGVDQDAQIRFIEEIQKNEGIDFRSAELMAKGLSDPVRFDYTVGFKLVGAWAALIFQSKTKIQRDHYREQFRAMLSDPEKEIFDHDYPDTLSDEYQKQYRKEKKAAKRDRKTRGKR